MKSTRLHNGTLSSEISNGRKSSLQVKSCLPIRDHMSIVTRELMKAPTQSPLPSLIANPKLDTGIAM